MRSTDPRVVLGLHRSRHQRPLLTGALDLGVTALDTSTNYLDFTSHKVLARVAGDLLPHFTLSTKVGYFPAPGGADHSLDPARLSAAVKDTIRDLGREPDLVFLHNPEQSLPGHSSEQNREVLAQACGALDAAAAKGWCEAWGIASWNPLPLPDLIDPSTPGPSVLMVRAGLLVGLPVLDAADRLAATWGLGDGQVWGMSPFGGSTRAPIWDRIDPCLFLEPDCGLSPVQAVFRAAYHLPRVTTMAVGTDDPTHLGELTTALACDVVEQVMREYRSLLRNVYAVSPTEGPR